MRLTSVIDTARTIAPPPRPPKPSGRPTPTHPFSEAVTGIPEGEKIPEELYEKLVQKYLPSAIYNPIKKKPVKVVL